MTVKLVSTGRLSVANLAWQRPDGSPAYTLVCKATFRLEPGISPLSAEPRQPFAANRHWRDDARFSLNEATDLVPGKKRPEVIVVGQAVAPGGVPAQSWTTRLAIGSVDKRLDVFCDRYWQPNGSLQIGPPVSSMPLYWERAPGGPDSDNPVGWSAAVSADASGRTIAPNFQSHGSTLRHLHDPLLPVGYGPIAPHWPPRTIHLHGHAARWSHDHWHQSPLPAEVDWAYFNAAPRDQQLSALSTDKPLILENLIAAYPRLSTRLSPIFPHLSLERASGSQTVPLLCDTLWIDTSSALATLTWRATIALLPGEQTVIAVLSEDATLATTPLDDHGEATVFAPARASSSSTTAEPFPLATHTTATSRNTTGSSAASLADIRDESAAAAPWHGPTDQTLHADALPADLAAVLSQFTAPLEVNAAIAERADSLPFAAATPLPASAARPPPQTLDAIRAAGDAVSWSGPASETLHADHLPADVAAALAAFSSPPQVAPAAYSASPGPPAMLAHSANQSGRDDLPITEPASYGHASEPSLIGPLATPELIARHQAPKSVASEPAPQSEQPAPAAEPSPRGESPLPLADYPLERCASISAALHCRPDDRSDILDHHQLESELWQRLRAHYDDEIKAAIQRGKLTTLHDHDKAYVAQLEQERGPITLEQYARLRVAAERGTRPATMQALQLPSPSLMPIERVWLRKSASDPAIPERMDDAIEAARDA